MINWDELEDICLKCKRCSLCRTRTNVVVGVGNRKSDIMFVGEAPGYNEDMQGEPFVGSAGQLLDKILKSVGFSRNEVYITNIVKCRPPSNRDPLDEEQKMCIDYLRCQFLLIKPKMVVCLGRISAKALIDPNFRISRMRGQWYNKKGIWFTATYHPSALLRDESKKRPVWEDFKTIRKKIDELRTENE